MRRILINSTSTNVRIAITDDGKLSELFTEEPAQENLVGNIYLGRVSKIVQGMNAAFVNIGLELDGFLHFSDVDAGMEDDDESYDDDDDRPLTAAVDTADVALRTARAIPRTGKQLPVFSTKRSGNVHINLHARQQVIVQVSRDAYAQKGVRLTTRVALTGRNVVLLPFEDSIGVSRKIFNVRERKRLRTIARSILPAGTGCIIRTAAAGLPDEDVKADFTYLAEQWKEIEEEVRKAKGPALLYREPDLAIGVIRDLFKGSVQSVLVDDRKLYRSLKNYLQRSAPHMLSRMELYVDTRPLFDAFGIEKDVQHTHSRQVPLPSGGSIVIEQTEAMVVIDVNSGRASNEKSQEANATKTNFEAVPEIARQLRLRDLGGIIIVDFIDMQDDNNKRRLLQDMKKELTRDKARTIVFPLTQLGIMQLTRQRIRRNIAERTTEECPMCFGTGKIQSVDTLVASLDRWMRNYRAQTWKFRVKVKVHPYVAYYLRKKTGGMLRRWLLSNFILVSLQEDEGLDGTQFRCYLPSGSEITRKYI